MLEETVVASEDFAAGIVNVRLLERPPPAAGGAQPAGQATATGQKNYNTHFNNWNMCISCGFDVPIWHTSKTCPAMCRRDEHQEGCDGQNHVQYTAQGHRVSTKGAHKNILPTNPRADQA